MTGHNQLIGKWGEEQALNYVETHGYTVLFRNWKSPYGELDLICQKNGIITFFEVKTRSGIAFGWPEEAVTRNKQEHLINSALAFIDEHPEFLKNPWQIDVIAILVESYSWKNFYLQHYENAVNGE